MPTSALRAGLLSRCPQCGEGELFASYLKFRDHCRACGADFKRADAGDGPAVFVVLIAGAIAMPFLFILQFVFDLPGWVALTLTMLVAVALCLALLPPFKATLFAMQWKHKASEATSKDLEP